MREPFGELRSMLHQPPSRELWDALLAQLEAFEEGAEFERAIAYAGRLLESWPGRLRRLRTAHYRALVGGQTTPLLGLVRAADLSAWMPSVNDLARVLNAPALGALTSLRLPGRCSDPGYAWGDEDVWEPLHDQLREPAWRETLEVFDTSQAHYWVSLHELLDGDPYPRLRALRLELSGRDESPSQLAKLAGSPLAERLEVFDASLGHGQDLARLCDDALLQGLEGLGLALDAPNEAANACLRTLFGAQIHHDLRWLRYVWYREPEALDALSANPSLGRLEELWLGEGVDGAALTTFAERLPALRALRVDSLSYDTTVPWAALGERALETLDLSWGSGASSVAAAGPVFRDSALARHLEHLRLEVDDATQEWMTRLGEAELPRLRSACLYMGERPWEASWLARLERAVVVNADRVPRPDLSWLGRCLKLERLVWQGEPAHLLAALEAAPQLVESLRYLVLDCSADGLLRGAREVLESLRHLRHVGVRIRGDAPKETLRVLAMVDEACRSRWQSLELTTQEGHALSSAPLREVNGWSPHVQAHMALDAASAAVDLDDMNQLRCPLGWHREGSSLMPWEAYIEL